MKNNYSMKRKAFLFTTIAIALSIVIISSYFAYDNYRLKDEIKSTEIRVVTANNFLKDVKDDMDDAIFIVGFRSLLSLEDYMMKYDNFLNNLGTGLNAAFSEAFLYGTIKSENMRLMENNTFLNWTEKMKKQANKTNIGLDFTINNVAISQSSPWMVDISVDLKIKANDTKNVSSWEISQVFTRKINITGFVDPLYLVNSDGKANNSIRKTTVSSFASQLPTHLLNSYYIEHTDAPSYLMRFENNLGSSANGIESLVNSQKRIDVGLPALDRSAVDFIYFGAGATVNCKIEGMEAYSWFKLDSNHLGFYSAVCDLP